MMRKQRRRNLDEYEDHADRKREKRLLAKHYVRIRDRVSLMSLCRIIYDTAKDHGVLEESDEGYWVPCWFFMAVWPAARKGDTDRAYDQAYRVMFTDSYRKAMETKYLINRKVETDSVNVGVWE